MGAPGVIQRTGHLLAKTSSLRSAGGPTLQSGGWGAPPGRGSNLLKSPRLLTSRPPGGGHAARGNAREPGCGVDVGMPWNLGAVHGNRFVSYDNYG